MNDTVAVALRQHVSPAFALDVTFEVPATGVTALLGRSGSGKTTILRALAGLEQLPGTIRFRGEIWQDDTRFLLPHQRHVGYVFQGAGLLPHLSVRGNLAYAQRRAPQGMMTFDSVVALTGIASLLDRRPARLSGGESQRASIARALLGQPRLLLMDEPLSALDTQQREGLLAELETLFGALAIPIFYVTHDVREAERLAARTITLEDGRAI